MQVVVQLEAQDAARFAAETMAALVRRRPTATLGFATGQTMVPFYRELVRIHRQGSVSFRDVTVFALDEYRGLAPSHPGSCHGFLNRHVLHLLDLDPTRVRLLDGLTPDPIAECARYERAIGERGGIDLQLLGCGRNGHIGFNEPGSSLGSRTRLAPLTESTRRANASAWGGDATAVPDEALTMGIGTILDARACLLLAFGGAKAPALAAALEGPITEDLPASVLQIHPAVTCVLDSSAATLLTRVVGRS